MYSPIKVVATLMTRNMMNADTLCFIPAILNVTEVRNGSKRRLYARFYLRLYLQ